MPFHIPAWKVAIVGKKGANANLIFRLGEIVLGFSILFVDGIVGLDSHGRKRVAAMRNLIADREIVSDIRDQSQ